MGWRDLDQMQRARFARILFEKMLYRYEQGAKEHGEKFTDDPLDQLETELLDGLFYVLMAKREREVLRREINAR